MYHGSNGQKLYFRGNICGIKSLTGGAEDLGQYLPSTSILLNMKIQNNCTKYLTHKSRRIFYSNFVLKIKERLDICTKIRCAKFESDFCFDPFSPKKLHVRYLTRQLYPELYRSLHNTVHGFYVNI